ncbi:hypothetical protein Tco_0274701, partial [Tanacetum coccineum]
MLLVNLFLFQKRTRSSVQAGGSGSAIASEELNTLSTSDVPLNVTPSITLYPISDDDDPKKVDVASRSKPNKRRKKTKAKKIFVDASVVGGIRGCDPSGLGYQDVQIGFLGPQGGGSGVLDSASQ